MSLFDLLRFKQKSSASAAKERLQIVISHQRLGDKPNFLPQLHQELVDVVSKYTEIDRDQIQVELQNEGDFSVLELNITIPSTLSKSPAKDLADI